MGNAPADFRGEKRSNKTHRSTTDPDPRLYRKGGGMEAKLCFIGRGLPAHCRAPARDHARRRPGYDAADFVEGLRSMNVRPHIAQNNSGRRSAIDKRTARHPGYFKSHRVRKSIEEAFGWIKIVGRLRKPKLKGLSKVDRAFIFAAVAYNLCGRQS
jgi:hypothetical protein